MVYGLLRDQITGALSSTQAFSSRLTVKKTLHMLPRAVREGQLSND
jgi:hypothetical protein